MKNIKGIIVISFIIISACKKSQELPEKGPDCSDHSVKYIDTEVANFKFKKGTYWVYIDSVSLVVDTVRVDTILHDGLKNGYYCPDNYFEKYVFMARNVDYSVYDKYVLMPGRVQLNYELEDANFSAIYQSSLPKIDSVFIYNKYYKSVYSYKRANDPNVNGNTAIYYSSAEFGFLKKEIFNTSNQLISKKLLKDKLLLR